MEVEEQQVEEESDFEPKIVTELPEDLFKKQKLNANADLLYKPVFSNRNSTAKNVISPSNSLFFFFKFFFFFGDVIHLYAKYNQKNIEEKILSYSCLFGPHWLK